MYVLLQYKFDNSMILFHFIYELGMRDNIYKYCNISLIK